ncbi:trans-sialidase [Trypanosoma cruzi]|nr:trans-sialidase [Trypanosoma cruzi]
MERVVVSLKRAPFVNATGNTVGDGRSSFPERHWSAGFPESVARRGGGWRSGIAPSLLLNAVVVDGKSLMGERECALSCDFSQWHPLERCMCVCLADLVFWIPISRYSVPQKWTET